MENTTETKAGGAIPAPGTEEQTQTQTPLAKGVEWAKAHSQELTYAGMIAIFAVGLLVAISALQGGGDDTATSAMEVAVEASSKADAALEATQRLDSRVSALESHREAEAARGFWARLLGRPGVEVEIAEVSPQGEAEVLP